MQTTAVMLVVLGSLGCQNPEPSVPSAPAIPAERPATPPAGEQPATPPPAVGAPSTPAVEQPEAPATASAAEMVPYNLPSYYGGPYPFDVLENPTFADCLHDTLYSVIFGRSLGVPSANEIMSAYKAGLYNH